MLPAPGEGRRITNFTSLPKCCLFPGQSPLRYGVNFATRKLWHFYLNCSWANQLAGRCKLRQFENFDIFIEKLPLPKPVNLHVNVNFGNSKTVTFLLKMLPLPGAITSQVGVNFAKSKTLIIFFKMLPLPGTITSQFGVNFANSKTLTLKSNKFSILWQVSLRRV